MLLKIDSLMSHPYFSPRLKGKFEKGFFPIEVIILKKRIILVRVAHLELSFAVPSYLVWIPNQMEVDSLLLVCELEIRVRNSVGPRGKV